MGQLAPLKGTQRIIEWDELPARVRKIPEGLNPLDEGVLMKHQGEWVALRNKTDVNGRPRYSLIVGKKGRRTGVTFATALDGTIIAGSRKSAGGDNIFYIGDTKEKGLEFVGYAAKFAQVIAEAQGQGVSGIEEFLFEDQDDKGTPFMPMSRVCSMRPRRC
jgi:phage FluMu gp28-like protein